MKFGEKMETKTYYGIQVNQTPDSKPFYLLSASAHEILEWADAPRKQEKFLAGFQRKLGDRFSDITDFLTHPDSHGRNIIPSSVIIATNLTNLLITPIENNGFVKIEIQIPERNKIVELKETISRLKQRLGTEELDSINLDLDPAEAIDGDEANIEDDADVPPESYLALIVKKLESVGEDFDKLDPEFRDAVYEYLDNTSKPGLILDGQHRVYGAKGVNEFSVNLPIVLIPDLEISEQVFHFYVLNNKARPLNKTELRSIVSTSLSNEEIHQLYDRFEQVGVVAEEASWTHKMNTDKNSPFRDLVNFGYTGSKAPIPENVANTVISKFIKMGRKYKPLYDSVDEWSSETAAGYEYRLNVFFAMWRAVKSKYPNAWQSAISEGKGQILQKVNLVILQEFLLDKLVSEMPRRKTKGEGSPFSDVSGLEVEVSFQLHYLSEEFYTRTWVLKGLDTGTGHKEFRSALDDAVNSQSLNLGNRKLFKQKTT